MAPRRTRTALYSQVARHRLGDAVAKAREHAGWLTTADFARATGRSFRSIYAVENGEPTVGQSVLHAVGRTLGERLPGWTEDTPRIILEGGPIPLNAAAHAPSEASLTEDKDLPLPEDEKRFVEGLINQDFAADEILELLELLRARKQERSAKPARRKSE